MSSVSIRGPLGFFRSFRNRVLLLILATVLISTLLTTLALRFGIRFALIKEIDRILQIDLAELSREFSRSNYPVSQEFLEKLRFKQEAHDLKDWYVRIIDSQDRQVWSSPGAPNKLPLGVDPVFSKPFTNLNRFRVAQILVESPVNSESYIIRIGSPMTPIDDRLRLIDSQVAILALIICLLAPPLSFLVANQFTRPLSELTTLADRFRPERLDERLPVYHRNEELDQLAKTINRLLDRIKKYLDQNRDFLMNAAHELRTPLAAIRSNVELAANRCDRDAELRETLLDLLDQCDTLQVLVNQLLLLSESEATRLKASTAPISLSELVRKSIDIFEPVAEDRGLRLSSTMRADLFVAGNRHHLRQVLNNLLDNAIKYTPAGGAIRVDLDCSGKPLQARLDVADTGIGINASDVTHVFERFFRADRSRQRDVSTRGMGLGLSICRAIVEAHDGKIELTSHPGKGTVVTICLPLVTPVVVEPMVATDSVEAMSVPAVAAEPRNA
jgi:two-component system heavy metal sensor histidine kinase CusS